MHKHSRTILISVLCCMIMSSACSMGVSANIDFSDDNGQTQEQVQVEEGNSSEEVIVYEEEVPADEEVIVDNGNRSNNADAVAGLFQGGIDDESSAEAQRIASPWTKVIRVIISVILLLLTAALFLITVLDLVYIGVPFVRKWLGGGEDSSSSSGGGNGFGDGGFGNGGFNYNNTSSQGKSGIGRIVSDEAIAAVQAASGSNGGGFNSTSQPASKKSTIISYLKKRVVFLVVFGISAVLLFGTTFTDLGLKLGEWIANFVGGLM